MDRSGRILQHPVLGPAPERGAVTIYYNGEPVPALEGDTVAAALSAAGIRVFRHSHRLNAPRGLFCGIGHCTDCAMEVDGVPNTRVCVTRVKDGMQVNSSRRTD